MCQNSSGPMRMNLACRELFQPLQIKNNHFKFQPVLVYQWGAFLTLYGKVTSRNKAIPIALTKGPLTVLFYSVVGVLDAGGLNGCWQTDIPSNIL